MGPQSGSCGYQSPHQDPAAAKGQPLQWVHSLVAVVMDLAALADLAEEWLQWVHSLVAVVMAGRLDTTQPLIFLLQWVHSLVAVVMHHDNQLGIGDDWLQWVHSLVAVVIRSQPRSTRLTGLASMGPQSGSCGYNMPLASVSLPDKLQWVHSLVAVVMRSALQMAANSSSRFNGSTVW